MSAKFGVGTVLFKELSKVPEIVQIVGDKIFPVVAPKGTDGDFIVYLRDTYSKKRNNMGNTEECKLFIVACSPRYDTSVELADLINTHCEGLEVEGSIRQMILEDSGEDWESDTYMQILLFDIK